MRDLRISPTFTLPPEAVTQTFGILAVRGAGKSNAAAVMAEEMFANKLPFVVVDPVGAWWGLRSSRDGKGAGLAVPIFGGRHGDVPLEQGAGQLIADLVVDQRLSCVLDVAELSETAKIRFLIDFGERLYRRNEEPLHLFLEEADDYAPQKPFREQARLLRVWENIVRRGRARGLGITMITQRSAALNKNVLTQIETLIALRTTSPLDRKAIGAWVSYHGEGDEIVDSLPGLKAGEAWIWSPSWLNKLERIQIRRRNTFDSGATPKDVKGKRAPANLADVDLGALEKEMAATIERAKAEDPKELHKRIRELEKELSISIDKPAKVETVIERVEVLVPHGPSVDALEELAGLGMKAFTVANDLKKALENVGTGVVERDDRVLKKGAVPGRGEIPTSPPRPAPTAARTGEPERQTPSEGEPNKSQQRILNAVMWLNAVGIEANKVRVAFLAQYKPGTGHFNNMLGACRSSGWIDYPSPGRVALTREGKGFAWVPDIPKTTEGLQDAVMERLNGSQQRILRVLIDKYPASLSRELLAPAAGYAAGTGHFNNMLGSIRSLGLIDYPVPGEVVALPVLFVEG